MTMENSGHEDTSREADKGQPATDAQVPNPSRRRFNRAGVGASAVVLTLASRSVLAVNTCNSASGWDSQNPSSPGDSGLTCTGLTPEGWLATTSWPIPATTPFVRIFGRSSPSLLAAAADAAVVGGAASSRKTELTLNDATVHEVMSGSKTPLVVKHLLAAYLNARSGKNTHPTDISVVKIYQEWERTREYQVTAGVRWQESRIVQYLVSTQS